MTSATVRHPRGRNFTRTSSSIPSRLLREGKWHLLPVYALALTSDLAREGITNSGSYRFADHIYVGRARGRYGIGWLLDTLFLSLPAARSMPERYLHTRRHVAAELRRAATAGESTRILSVPCGIARELVEGADDVPGAPLPPKGRSRLIGMDLDGEPLELSRALAGSREGFEFVQGDALEPASFPTGLDLIVSTGLGEFLDDRDLARFYANCLAALKPGGMFVTSATSRSRFADWLLREIAELHSHYRGADTLRAALEAAGFTDVVIEPERLGLQWLATATRPRVAA